MLRLSLVVSGLVCLIAGTLLMAVAPAAAQEPPRPMRVTLAAQRVEVLPQEPLCWNVFQEEIPPGVRGPATGYVAPPLTLAYVFEGQVQVEYAGGPTRTVNAGEGTFVGANNWFARANVGTAPARGMVFLLTCQPPPSRPGFTRVASTGVLPGIRPGPVPYVVIFAMTTQPVGAQRPAQVNSGPVAIYVLEGALAAARPAGVTQYKAGDLFVTPPGTPDHITNVGNTPVRTLFAFVRAVDDPPTRELTDVRLPSTAPAALPRTGEASAWAGPLAILVGVVLLVAGIGLRRAKV